MWSIAPFLATAAAISDGVGLAVIPVFMSGFSPFLILTTSFFYKRAYWKHTSFDYLCGVLSGLALTLWYITSNPDIAIVFAIVSDALAAVPTLIKAWRNPKTESVWPYLIGIFSPISGLVVAVTWGFSELAFPVYLVVINFLLFSTVIRKNSDTKKVAGPMGFEPMASGSAGRCHNPY